MGCSLNKPDILDEKKSLALVSDTITNDCENTNKKLQIINQNLDINILLKSKNVNIFHNIAITKNNKPFIFIKIRPKKK